MFLIINPISSYIFRKETRRFIMSINFLLIIARIQKAIYDEYNITNNLILLTPNDVLYLCEEKKKRYMCMALGCEINTFGYALS